MMTDEQVGAELQRCCIGIMERLLELEGIDGIEFQAVLLTFALYCKMNDVDEEKAHGFLTASFKAATHILESGNVKNYYGDYLQ